MPRRLNYEIHETTGTHAFIMVKNDLTHMAPPKHEALSADLDAFASLANSLGSCPFPLFLSVSRIERG